MKNIANDVKLEKKYTEINHNFTKNELMSTKNGAREGPGEPPRGLGRSSGSPGGSRGRPGQPFGLPRAPPGSRLASILGAFFRVIFLMNFELPF